MFYNKKRVINKKIDKMKGSYLGPQYLKNEIKNELDRCGANYLSLNKNKMIDIVTNELASKKAIGWVQGRMEFGPRALGARSIIADPRSPKMQKQLNLKVKYRESFRPFAPSILYENLSEWFNQSKSSPYMLYVADVKNEKRVLMTKKELKLFGIDKLNIKRSSIPAVTHVDYSSRIQTVHKETNKLYYDLINSFFKKTGCPILVNTSFNIRGEPIVCSPRDAFNCFMGTDLDILVIENFLLFKKDQDNKLLKRYKFKYELD